MNQIFLMGHVGKVETRAAGNKGDFACNFSVATRHSWKDKSGEWKEETQWHNCVKWIKHADDAPQKGDKVFVEGSLENRSYEAKEGGKRYITEVKVKNMLVAPKSDLAPLPVSPTFDDKGSFNDSEIPF